MPILYGGSKFVGDLPHIWAVLWIIHTCLLFVLLVVGSWLYLSNSLQSFGYFMEDPRHSNEVFIMLSWLPLVTAGAPCLIWGSSQDLCDTSLLLVLGFLFVYMPLLDEPRVLPFLWVCYSVAAGARCADLRLRTSTASGVEISSFGVRVLLLEAASHAALRARMMYLNRTRIPLTASLLEEKAQLLQVKRPIGAEYWPDRSDGDAARIVRQVRARRLRCREELTGAFVWAICFSHSLSPDLLLHILSFLQSVPLRPSANAETASLASTSLIPIKSNMEPSESSSMSSLTLLRRRFQARLRSGLHPQPGPGLGEEESLSQGHTGGRSCSSFQVLGILLSLAWMVLIPPMISRSEEPLALEVSNKQNAMLKVPFLCNAPIADVALQGDGVLGLHVNQSPSLWLRSLGQLHWGLELQGISVGSGEISFCAPKHKQPGQRTACGMIPDSGTTLINGPREQVLQLYEEICRSWPRCMEAQVALEQELGNLTAENQTMSGVSLLQHGVPGLEQSLATAELPSDQGTKAIIAKVLHILAGTFAASRMSNATSAANRTQAVTRGSRRLFALDLQRNETPRRAGEATTGVTMA
ncbi:unnamed protein product [Symbiodinium microadriaticum]|nr:unnamed protein product [Symbiodinium microadriaticum]